MSNETTADGVLITGASGYLGKLIAITFLRRSTGSLLLPARAGRSTADSIIEAIADEMARCGDSLSAADRERLHVVFLPPNSSLDAISRDVEHLRVRQVVHAAACLDYFNAAALELANVSFTKQLLERSRSWGIERFVHISSAFCAGYTERPIPETELAEPPSDPTDYTRTKRAAERLVADSGVPFLCIRPTVVIGDSSDGHYSGKRYGLYQLWNGIERFLCTQWEAELHLVAPLQPMHLIHQDAFKEAFWAAWRWLPSGSFFNMVSDPERAPDARQLWELWVRECLLPDRVFYHDRIGDYPRGAASRHQRALMALGSVNLEIAAHRWSWELSNMRRLTVAGMQFEPVTLDSVKRCQRAFMNASTRIKAFMEETSARSSCGSTSREPALQRA